MEKINIVITMDCERATSETHHSASGPRDYEESAVWISAFDELSNRRGWPVTYFLHPEVATAQPELFKKLESQTACLGLHLHPWRFGDGRYAAELGGLTEEQSRIVLKAAAAEWTAAIGKRPLFFRPGAMSANDTLFKVLVDLGFIGGSISMPGRIYPDVHAVWAGSPPDPFRAHAAFRQVPGSLEFAEVPISVDISNVNLKSGRWFHWDLRPDFPDADYESIASNIVGQIVSRAPPVPAVCLATHNDNDFTNPNDRVCRNFVRVLDAITQACVRHNVEPVGATIADITRQVLEKPVFGVTELRRASGKVIYERGEQMQIKLA